MIGDAPGQETVRSAVKPPRAEAPRPSLPWASWQQLAQAHPALTAAPRGPAGFLRRLARKLRPRPTPDPHPRRPAR